MSITNGYERAEITQRLPITSVYGRYVGGDVNEKGFCRCPFHNERTASFKLYTGNNSFYCFGCGVGGDVIKLCSMLRNIPYYQAMKELDEDFNLGVFRVKSPTQQMREAAKRACDKKEYERRIDRKREQYNILTDYLKELREMPLTERVLFQIDWADRLLDRFGKWRDEPFELMPDSFDAAARVEGMRQQLKGVTF